MADVEFKIQGVDALTARMRALPVELRKKPARSALGKAAKVIREQAQANARQLDDPETGRAIADNIVQRLRSRYNRRTGDVMISVGVATEKGRIPKGNPDTGPKGNTPHWHLLELGTESMAAQPFLRPAAEAKAGAAINEFAAGLDQALTRLTKRLAKQGK
jgi:HK97 gp10 family phage protein